MNSRFHFLFGVAIVGLLSASIARAQQPMSPPEQPVAPTVQPVPSEQPVVPSTAQPAAPGYQQGMGQEVQGATPAPTAPQFDRTLAQLLILGNQKEIATSQFAQGRASADSVKNFAQRMIREHTDFMDRLQQAAFGTQQGQGAQTSSAGQPAGQQQAQQQQTQARVTQSQDPLLNLLERIGQRDIQLTQQELGRSQGAQFDAAYIGQQLVAHVEMLAALQASEQHASPQLKQLINQGVQSTEQHLNEARGIMTQLEQQIAATARREAGQQK